MLEIWGLSIDIILVHPSMPRCVKHYMLFRILICVSCCPTLILTSYRFMWLVKKKKNIHNNSLHCHGRTDLVKAMLKLVIGQNSFSIAAIETVTSQMIHPHFIYHMVFYHGTNSQIIQKPVRFNSAEFCLGEPWKSQLMS